MTDLVQWNNCAGCMRKRSLLSQHPSYIVLKFLSVKCYTLSYLPLPCFKFSRIRHVVLVVKSTLTWCSSQCIIGINQGKMKTAVWEGGSSSSATLSTQNSTHGPESNLFICDWRIKLTVIIRKDKKKYLIENRAFPH